MYKSSFPSCLVQVEHSYEALLASSSFNPAVLVNLLFRILIIRFKETIKDVCLGKSPFSFCLVKLKHS